MKMDNSTLAILLSTGTFMTVFLIVAGVWQHVRQRSKRRELIKKICTTGIDSASYISPSDTDTDTAVHPFFDFISRLGTRIAPPGTDYSYSKLKFLKAGIRNDNASTICWGFKIVFAVCFPLIFIMSRLTLLKIFNLNIAILIGILLALFGFYLPDLWLKLKTALRKEKIMEGLPDALDLMVVCVEAGMGLDAAIHRVAREIQLNQPLLSEELKLVNLELRAGKLRADALRNLALRTDLEEVNTLVTLLIQTDKFGTSISKSLRIFSDSFRTKRAQKAEEIAAKLPVKMLFPLIFFIFPSLFVAIIGPGIIRIYHAFFTQ